MKSIARVLSAIAIVAVAAACSPGSPIPIPFATGPLVTVETRGGLCVNGPCGSTVTIERDGRVHVAAKPPNELGTVPAGQLAALDAAIRATDWAALKSHPFTGECPTAYDGQESIFEFGAPGGTQRIATCEIQVDAGSPLFVAVTAALGSVAAAPAP